jgi:hypothetical protein
MIEIARPVKLGGGCYMMAQNNTSCAGLLRAIDNPRDLMWPVCDGATHEPLEPRPHLFDLRTPRVPRPPLCIHFMPAHPERAPSDPAAASQYCIASRLAKAEPTLGLMPDGPLGPAATPTVATTGSTGSGARCGRGAPPTDPRPAYSCRSSSSRSHSARSRAVQSSGSPLHHRRGRLQLSAELALCSDRSPCRPRREAPS